MNASEDCFEFSEASPFNKFLEEVNTWKLFNLSEDVKNRKEFLDNLLLQNKKTVEMPTNEEIRQIHSELVFEDLSNKNRLKIKKKWSNKEKKFLVWALYYYTQLFNIKIEEMVRFHK